MSESVGRIADVHVRDDLDRTEIGNGPEMVSAEMEDGLDLRGEWEGTWQDDDGNTYPAKLSGQIICLHFPPLIGEIDYSFSVNSEGGENLRVGWGYHQCLGKYRLDESRLYICFCDAEFGFPTSIHGGSGQHLLILHRVKPRK